ncbi:flagellar hook-basal body complex protein FliE [Clostridium sp. D2Q-14]|uniref:flagellar hook-basal body complex protein FliE n=1 Tax=Anaeromonas gelatinilytica TaxID=2683194 RepID=UPI00193C07C2|nr:flagellar hook-basal body complex protein FliE [Anaeromonas gelatinilytica]MBS4536057.1 flagellar hook-basal body complex protein FliE [Anaeromonas gelatinilytica]
MEIQGLSNLLNTNEQVKNINKEKTTDFGEFLNNALSNVNSLQKQSEYLKNMLAVGEVDNIHSAVIASEKADLALQLTLNIRNKVMDAYKEIMRMQI